MSVLFKIELMDMRTERGHTNVSAKMEMAMTIGHLLYKLRRLICLSAEHALFLFIDGSLYTAPVVIGTLIKHMTNGVLRGRLYREASFGQFEDCMQAVSVAL